jgi:hypothetical protein
VPQRERLLFLHETHQVVGAREQGFEDAFRRGWLPLLGKGEDARLLYFLHHAHGTGVSYNVVTITALRDGAAWERLGRRVHAGDLAAWASDVDALRRDVRAKILVPLPWSPLQSVDLDVVPTSGEEHEASLFMEDTVEPYEGRLDEYIERSGSHYAREMKRADRALLLSVDASFRTAFGSHRRREIVLWQKVVQTRGLVPLLTREVPDEYKQPGTWMHDALALRDRWESKLLRTASWSPWY